MSILIKGMEMPEHCGECKLKAEYDDETFCPFFADNVEYWIAAGRRHEDCPLVPVPPHGRLIDADAEVEVWDVCGRQGVFPHFTTTVSKFLLGHLVGKIPPTIIPAEEGET